MKLPWNVFGKLLILIGLMGFLGVGLLLYTNHAGFAIKITNYIYCLLFIGVVFELLNYVRK